MKKKLIQYGVCTTLGALIAVWVMDTEGMFVIENPDLNMVCLILADAFFVPGILILLFGALLWISTTGLFDSVSYALRTAAHSLLPFLHFERKSFYDYKVEKAEKRGNTPYFAMIVGAFYLVLSGISILLWSI